MAHSALCRRPWCRWPSTAAGRQLDGCATQAVLTMQASGLGSSRHQGYTNLDPCGPDRSATVATHSDPLQCSEGCLAPFARGGCSAVRTLIACRGGNRLRSCITRAVERIQLPVLAQELGLGRIDMMKLVQRSGVNVVRYAAMLSSAQADRVRQQFRTEGDIERRRQETWQAAEERAAQAAPTQQRREPLPQRTADETQDVGPPRSCACCGIEITVSVSTLRADPGDIPRRCRACTGHFEIGGEAPERQLARLAEHDNRLRQAYWEMWRRAQDLNKRLGQSRRSRNSWRGVLVEIMDRHAETTTGCSCGSKSFPCVTWHALEKGNRGITKEVDHFLTLKDDERRAALYPHDHWDEVEGNNSD
jgi:hypothetical protein